MKTNKNKVIIKGHSSLQAMALSQGILVGLCLINTPWEKVKRLKGIDEVKTLDESS